MSWQLEEPLYKTAFMPACHPLSESHCLFYIPGLTWLGMQPPLLCVPLAEPSTYAKPVLYALARWSGPQGLLLWKYVMPDRKQCG
jgi:hypothetical protein